ncbi:MAG: UDP-N-acetylmuramate--L-alanine ligase [Chitinivibrionales bacterium]|nr:UDP-N-acetylmuramate--L-alanine ligase [Chitinivibrionales bacterium]
MLRYKKRMHFAGIGGVGMSALAEILHARGFAVTGSDRMKSAITERLKSMGIDIQYDHTPALVKESGMLVYSSAISGTNPERVFAKKNNIPCYKRSRILGELMQCHFSICVAGTHGKTTTSSMLGRIFIDAQRDPTLILGGFPVQENSNARSGGGPLLVAEADEYDRSFLDMEPVIAVITNIESEHLECYADLDQIKRAFVDFCEKVPFYGAVIAVSDNPVVREIIPQINRTVITCGFDCDTDYHAVRVGNDTENGYVIQRRGEVMGVLKLQVPGKHNVYNALTALAAAMEMDVSFSDAAGSLERFRGVKRRFEISGEVSGVTIIDDYAHHPDEIRATFEAARSSEYKNIIAVFQPHLYTRTRDFMDEFADALCGCKSAIITDIYKSREEPIEGVSAQAIVDKMRIRGHADVAFIADKNAAAKSAAGKAGEGDVIICMGAGDINEVIPLIARELSNG